MSEMVKECSIRGTMVTSMRDHGVVKWRNGETLTGLLEVTIPCRGVLTLQNGDVYTGQ
jgi:hypothetical protein